MLWMVLTLHALTITIYGGTHFPGGVASGMGVVVVGDLTMEECVDVCVA